MTSLPFSDAQANELFNRVVRHYALGLPKRFSNFWLSKTETALNLYEELPPTRVIYPVITHHYESGIITLGKPDRCFRALDALRQLQVLEDMSDLRDK